jgi:hypothetical protein
MGASELSFLVYGVVLSRGLRGGGGNDLALSTGMTVIKRFRTRTETLVIMIMIITIICYDIYSGYVQ